MAAASCRTELNAELSNKKGLAWVEVKYIMYGRWSLGSSRNMEL